MARPRIVWSNAQLRLIMSGIERFDREFPTDNARFLDAVIDEVRMVTGKLYGSGTYARLLRDTGDMTRVTRRPGTATIQKAIERAQALKPSLVSAGDDSGEAPSFDVHSLRRAIEPVVRDTLVPLHALLAQLVNAKPVAGEGATVAVSGEQAVQLQLARASLEDAHSRIRRLEEENGRLRCELGGAVARATIAETRIAELLGELHRAIAGSSVGAEALNQAAKRLEGTERFLKTQNDAVRLQATAEADGLRRVVEQLRDQVGHLQIECDQYRRALTAQRSTGPANGR